MFTGGDQPKSVFQLGSSSVGVFCWGHPELVFVVGISLSCVLQLGLDRVGIFSWGRTELGFSVKVTLICGLQLGFLVGSLLVGVYS